MNRQKVYVVRHYAYDHWYEFVSLIGLAGKKGVAANMARDFTSGRIGEPVITYSLTEHERLVASGKTHIYAELREVEDEV